MVSSIKIWSVFFAVLRGVLACRLIASFSPVLAAVGASEILCSVWTVRRTFAGVVCGGWGWAVPVLYLVPLLFCAEGALASSWGPVCLGAVGLQLFVRLVLGESVTVGPPVFAGVVSAFPYSRVRHPLAMVEIVLCISAALALPSSHNSLVAIAGVCACVAAALIEEEFLQGFFEYRVYAHSVRARFLPGLI